MEAKEDSLPMSERHIFNWQIVTVILALLVQFTGVVWIASKVTFRVDQLGVDMDNLKLEIKADREKTGPMYHEFKFFERDLKEMKEDIKFIKDSVKSK
jgi:NhaP-type Na+/H+ and K+/H+ antiporter